MDPYFIIISGKEGNCKEMLGEKEIWDRKKQRCQYNRQRCGRNFGTRRGLQAIFLVFWGLLGLIGRVRPAARGLSSFPSAGKGARLIAVPAAGAAGTAAPSPAFPQCAEGQAGGQEQQKQQEQTGQVHPPIPTASPIVCTTKAASQAMTHWPTTTPTAHFRPSSRLMAAMAATQGV